MTNPLRIAALLLSILVALVAQASAWGTQVARPTTVASVPRNTVHRLKPTTALESVSFRCCDGACDAACKALSPKNVASAFAGITLANGAALALAPHTVLTRAYGMNVSKGSLAALYGEILGCVDIGLAVSFFLAGRTSINKVVAYGLLPRLVFFAKNILTGKFSDLGIKIQRATIPLTAATALVAALLSGKAVPEVALKIVAALHVLVGLSVIINPVGVSKVAGVDLDAEDNVQAKAMYKQVGQDIFAHGVLIGSLVLGYAPITSLGYASLALSMSQLETLLSKSYLDLQVSRGMSVGYILALAAFSARFLL